MSSDLTVDIENHQNFMMNNNNNSSDRLGFMAIDQDGEWDISLFDELDDLPDADELIQALEHAGYATEVPELDFDIDLPPWNGAATGSTCTDGEVSVDSLSPAHTLSSVPSPASVEALSPYSYSDEALSPQSQPSPVSVCSESSGYSEAPTAAKRAPKRTSLTPRAKPAQTAKRPIQLSTKVSIQPKPLLTALPLAHAAPPLQAKTIIIQPLHATMLPVVKPAPISIQPAPPPGRPMVLPQSGQVLQIQTPQTVGGHVVTMPTLSQDVAVTGTVAAPQMVSVTLGRTPSSDDDSKVSQRQQRMIKNRESASLSRKKKKEYLLTLEARLKLALTENELLKNENGSLKRQLEGMLAENTVLQTISPKRKAVCLMAVLVFLVLNVGPTSLFQGGPGSQLLTGPGSQLHTGPVRHLLAIPQEDKAEVVPEHPTSSPADSSSEDKELMLVKDLILRPPPPCLPPVNRTKCMELAQELSVWVRRHEVEQTKSRHMNNNNQHKPNSTILKTTDEEVDIAPVDQYTVQYTEPTEEKSPGSELQVYYAPHRTYSDFFDEINRRGDTFYVVSFRRDHLLLPATNHNKGSRPKMSVVLPAMNINESIIPDKGFEIMMQIDCEVTNTRILHIKSSTIPPLLRVNHTDTFYKPSPAESQATPPVGVLMGSA